MLDPSSNSLTGAIKVDVHYYEDGNVRLLTTKPVKESASSSSASASEVVRQIAGVEKKYQEDLNRAFTQLNEGAFKGLRRQLPVTRQKVEWEKIGGYRVSFFVCLFGLSGGVTDIAIAGSRYWWRPLEVDLWGLMRVK